MSSLAGLSATCGWPLCDVWTYGTPMGGYPIFSIVLGLYYVSCDSVRSWYPGKMLRILLECAVSLMWLSYRQIVGKMVLNLGVLVSGWVRFECYSTFAFLNLERQRFQFLKSLTFRPSLRAKGRLEWELLRLCRCFSHSGRATPKAVL